MHLLFAPLFSCSVVPDSLWPPWIPLPGSSVRGVSQGRILEWIAAPFSRRSSEPRSPALPADSLPAEIRGKASLMPLGKVKHHWRTVMLYHISVFNILRIIAILPSSWLQTSFIKYLFYPRHAVSGLRMARTQRFKHNFKTTYSFTDGADNSKSFIKILQAEQAIFHWSISKHPIW